METLILLIIALLNAYTAWATMQNKQDIRKIELATNSMKDALVAATDKSAHAAGREEGRQEGAATAAVLARGALSSHGPLQSVGGEEVPTKDRRVAEAAERTASAQERVADSTERKETK